MRLRYSLLTLIASSSILLSGCAPQLPVADEPLVPLSESGMTNDNFYNQDDVQLLSSSSAQPAAQPVAKEGNQMKTLAEFEPIKATEATITTAKGEITFTLYGDKAPLTVTNFLNLAKSGFYDGIKFHRIIPDFMAQVGDPKSKDDAQKAAWGSGGPGYMIADEFSPDLKHDSEGTVSMANAGPNSGGSQFFITYEATSWLDGKHAVFGKVTAGMDVLKQLEIGDQIVKISYK